MIEYLLKIIIFNETTDKCIVKGNRRDWHGLPKSKSLFYAAPGTGLPIGNLTSQLFANIHLNDFDHFVKKELKCKYYGRYVDDMVFVHHDKEYLKTVVSRVRDYFKNELQLNLHENKIYLQHCNKGVKFLGTVIKPWRIYIANQSKINFRRKIEDWNKHLIGVNSGDIVRNFKKENFTDANQKLFIAQVNSYLGLMKHYKTSKLRKKLVNLFSLYFWNYVYLWYDRGKVVGRK